MQRFRHGPSWAPAAALTFGAILVDVWAPAPYVMTPLYALPILLLAHTQRPRVVAGAAALLTGINIASAIAQATPPEVWVLYTFGLLVTAYLAVTLAAQRQQTAHFAQVAERRAEEAEASRQLVERFTRMVAHDLRNPLSTLVGYADLLQDTRLSPAQQQQAVSRMNTATIQLERLVADLNDTTALLSGHFAVHPGTADLATIAREIVAFADPVQSGQVRLIESPEHLEGPWDRDRLTQIVTNLVTNAVKFSPPGSPVTVAVGRTPSGARVTVCDQGPGISPDELAQLFRPFVRLAASADIVGTGLGLFISQEIATAHGGRIDVASEVGQGSTFSLVLPVADPQRGVVPEK